MEPKAFATPTIGGILNNLANKIDAGNCVLPYLPVQPELGWVLSNRYVVAMAELARSLGMPYDLVVAADPSNDDPEARRTRLHHLDNRAAMIDGEIVQLPDGRYAIVPNPGNGRAGVNGAAGDQGHPKYRVLVRGIDLGPAVYCDRGESASPATDPPAVPLVLPDSRDANGQTWRDRESLL